MVAVVRVCRWNRYRDAARVRLEAEVFHVAVVASEGLLVES
jgi:hypothetical protein